MEVTTINNQRETSTNNKTKLTSLTLLHQLYVKSTNSHTTSILSTFLSSTCLLNQPPEYKLFERRKQNRDKKKRNWFGRKGRGGIPIIIPKTEGSQMTKVMRKDSENTSSLMIFIQQLHTFHKTCYRCSSTLFPKNLKILQPFRVAQVLISLLYLAMRSSSHTNVLHFPRPLYLVRTSMSIVTFPFP